MPISERKVSPVVGWPDPDELIRRASSGGVVLLPDEITELDGKTVASFREAAQALRVSGSAAGTPVEFAAPHGARLGVYRERAAEWVLPFVLSIPAGVASGLIVNELQRMIDSVRGAGTTVTPTVWFREVVIEDGRVSVRELAGPADEVRSLLAARQSEQIRAEAERGDSPRKSRARS